MSNYQIHIKQVPPQVIVTERLAHATLAGLNDAMNATLSKVAIAVEPASAAQGAPFAFYYNEPFTPDDIDVEMGMPVAATAKVDETKGPHRRVLEGGPVAYTTHVGPYAAIGAAYEALYKWIEQHGHRRLGPPRETYLVGPGQGASPDEYRTELAVPID